MSRLLLVAAMLFIICGVLAYMFTRKGDDGGLSIVVVQQKLDEAELNAEVMQQKLDGVELSAEVMQQKLDEVESGTCPTIQDNAVSCTCPERPTIQDNTESCTCHDVQALLDKATADITRLNNSLSTAHTEINASDGRLQTCLSRRVSKERELEMAKANTTRMRAWCNAAKQPRELPRTTWRDNAEGWCVQIAGGITLSDEHNDPNVPTSAWSTETGPE